MVGQANHAGIAVRPFKVADMDNAVLTGALSVRNDISRGEFCQQSLTHGSGNKAGNIPAMTGDFFDQ